EAASTGAAARPVPDFASPSGEVGAGAAALVSVEAGVPSELKNDGSLLQAPDVRPAASISVRTRDREGRRKIVLSTTVPAPVESDGTPADATGRSAATKSTRSGGARSTS